MKLVRPLAPLALAPLLALALLAATPANAQQYQKIKRLGTRQAICKPAISTGDELQAFFRNQRGDVLAILADAGWEGNPEDLFAAVEAGNFEQQSYPVGSRLEWMGRRVKGRIKAEPRVEWVGKAPFQAFEIDVASNCKAYRIIVPNACCNVSLVSAEPQPTPEPTLDVTQGEDSTVTVTAIAPGGAAVEVTKIGPDGSREQLPLDENGTWTGKLDPAEYRFEAVATDECGTSPVVATPFALAAPPKRSFRPYVAPFIGRQVRDYDPFLVGVEGGLQFPLNDKFALFGQVGGSYNTDDSELSTYADLGGDLLFERGFVGLGIGVWDINNSDTRDNTLLLHGGGDTPWTAGTASIQWFGEARIFEDGTHIQDNNILKLGLRFIWK